MSRVRPIPVEEVRDLRGVKLIAPRAGPDDPAWDRPIWRFSDMPRFESIAGSQGFE